MILIGQYDSPFVRRVAIAMALYRLEFEHRPWSTFGDADRLRQYNPLTRVPTLVLDDGDVLIDSHLMLDYLDRLVPAEQRMFPVTEPERRRALKVAALACGIADKAVSLFYERRMHKEMSELWVKRCRTQITATVAELEAGRAGQSAPYWLGDRIGHADVAVVCALRFAIDAHADLVDMASYPALKTHRERLEALPVFETYSQAFAPPA
jgi:glutathione S-transferase